MWKDFFYFSKSERRAILFLLTLLFIFMCIWVLFPVKEESLEQDQEGIEEIKNFLAGVHEMEEKESLRYSYDKPKRREVVLAAFDPNSADSIEFLQRGLPPFIAHTILQYRRAGGKFRTADDFSRVYGLSSEKFNMLKRNMGKRALSILLLMTYQRLFGGNRIHCTLSKRRRKIRWRFINIRKEL